MNKRVYRYLIFTAVLLGVLLRAVEYYENHSLWVDEAITVSKLKTYTLYEQIHSKENIALDKIHTYPAGYLILSKGIMTLLGDSELSLRSYSFLSSIAALFLFWLLLNKIFGPSHWTILGVFLLAISRDLIYYAAEFKPYSSDVMFTLILYWMFFSLISKVPDRTRTIRFGLLGILCLYFSFPSAFILAGAGGSLLIFYSLNRDKSRFQHLAVMALFWLVGLTFYYFFSLQYFISDKKLINYWETSFMPIGLNIIPTLQWIIVVFKRALAKFLQYPAGLSGVLVLIGIISLYFRRKEYFCVFVIPIFLGMIISGFKIYPFDGRTIAFLFPSIILLITEGAQTLCQDSSQKIKKAISFILIGFLCTFPVIYAVNQLREPWGHEEVKPAISYLRKNVKVNDLIAVYPGAYYAYKYYAPKLGFVKGPMILDKTKLVKMITEGEFPEDFLISDRLWILFSHVKHFKEKNERLEMLSMLDLIGTREKSFLIKLSAHSHPGTIENDVSASLYLYRLNEK